MNAKETLTYLYQHGHIICYADYKIICAELDQPITEHPDVQRLIIQVETLSQENKELKMEMLRRYKHGHDDGLRAFAWWKDGVQYVGTCGTTLKEALKGVEK